MAIHLYLDGKWVQNTYLMRNLAGRKTMAMLFLKELDKAR
jgi:hypothetical protein